MFLVLPFLIFYIVGLDRLSLALITLFSSLAIIGSGYLIGFSTEKLQFIVSQALAFAFLAIIQTLPEYAVEAFLSYSAAFDSQLLHYVTANLTGANRLLIGLGWPSIILISYVVSGRRNSSIRLERDQSVEVVFLGFATLYSFVIVLKGYIDIFDAIVLTYIFTFYIIFASRIPPKVNLKAESKSSPLMISSFLIFGMVVVFISAGPFVDSILQTARALGISDYLLIQWVAPIVSEAPEAVTVVYWAARSGMEKEAIINLISSKVNQWTLLFAVIPVVYSVASGGIRPIFLTSLQTEEIFLTAAQSLFGFLCILDLYLSSKESLVLISLFLLQFFLPSFRTEVGFAYIIASVLRLLTESEKTKAVKSFANLFNLIIKTKMS